MLLYHGSNKIIEKPIKNTNKNYKEFGSGFYMTMSEESAKCYASSYSGAGYISKYEFEANNLRILKFNDYPILAWLAVVYNNRMPNNKRLKQSTLDYLNKNFLIDITKYDVVIGYRCDDMFNSIAEAFFNNAISVDVLNKLFIQNKENVEVVLLTDKAINNLKFIGYEDVENRIYYKKRKNIFETDFKNFASLVSNNDVNELLTNNTAKKMINNFGFCISFASKYLNMLPNEFLKLFTSSNISVEYAKANPKYIFGISGVELAYEVLIDLGFSPKKINEYELEKDLNFWVGRIIAYIQYVNDFSYKYLAEIINLNSLLEHYEELANESLSSINEYVFKNLVSNESKTRLQARRKNADLSQSELAEIANINIRTLQQYEIKNKNINNASISSVIRLADALGCNIEDILEYNNENDEN